MPAELPDFAASQLFLRRLAYRLVREEGLAEDLVQETWRTWLERAPAGLSEPRAWMAKVLRNLAFNARREKERRSARELAAARAESVEPETDGTLEAQARLVDALRTLEEPYRSTLLQRYYHDLAPKEIAERGGVPLDTVKSRLARGLAKLREDLDRRYGGDRGAWCHWLWTLARPGAGVPTDVERGPGSRGSPAGRAPLASSAAGSKALLPGVVAGAALLVGAVCVVLLRDGRGDGLRPGVVAGVEPARSTELVATRRERAAPVEGELPAAANLASEPEPVARAPKRSQFLFEWPQLGGRASHDPRNLRWPGSIRAPMVLWHEPEARGAPTFLGGHCFVGGEQLLRLDSWSGERLDARPEESGAGFSAAPVLVERDSRERQREIFEELKLDPGLQALLEAIEPEVHAMRKAGKTEKQIDRFLEKSLGDFLSGVQPESARTSLRLVLARRLADGGVTAFEGSLEAVAWEWRPSSAPRHVWPPCLAGERLLVPCDDELFAIDPRTGKELWKVSTGVDRSAIEMVPAAGELHAYFASEDGVVYSVSLQEGHLVRLHETGGWFFGAHPVLFASGLALVDRGSALMRPAVDLAPGEELWPGPNDRRGRVWAFDWSEVLWQTPYEGTAPSTPGVGADQLLLGTRDQVLTLDFDGKLPEGRAFKTGSAPLATPAEHEGHVMAGTAEGTLELFDAQTRQHLWTFRLPPGERVEEFVWAGPRVFVATTLGLFCLANDPAAPPEQLDFTLDWTGALALQLELERSRAARAPRAK